VIDYCNVVLAMAVYQKILYRHVLYNPAAASHEFGSAFRGWSFYAMDVTTIDARRDRSTDGLIVDGEDTSIPVRQ